MKKLILTLFVALFGFTAQAQEQVQTPPSTVQIKFDKNAHDFGKIEKGGDGTHTFTFTNEGDETLVLSSVRASCGCTTPSWSREPIKPGETGTIKVKYDTNRMGSFHKSITVQAKAEGKEELPKTVRLTIQGQVENTPAAPSTPAKQGGSVIAK